MSNTGSGLLAGKWPAVIARYDADTRTCAITIPGQTDGAEGELIAEIEYPIGDKSRHATMTEIEILPGDPVWVEFIQGDPRFPLITGWRNPVIGNSKDWRRWHHANIELLADKQMRLIAGESILLQVGGTSITLTAGEIASIAAAHTVKGAVSIEGAVTQTGGDITSDGYGLQAHHHITGTPGLPTSPSKP